MKRVLLFTVLVATASRSVASQQQPLAYPCSSATACKPDSYHLQWPVRKVAVVGAGVGGLIAYRDLTQQGFEVDLYERDNAAGGNWHYTDELPADAPIPNAPIAVDEETTKHDRRLHRAPKPIWASLKSDAPAVGYGLDAEVTILTFSYPIQEIREMRWPKDTEWELPHAKITRYLRAFASWHGVNTNDANPHVFYNTRVELVERETVGWKLIAKELVKTQANVTRATWSERNYDAVVVATGIYNAPNVPTISGIEQWNDRFPGKIRHSRQYRRPDMYEGKTVLVIGAAASGGEIAREVIQHAKQVYVSIREDKFQGPHYPLSGYLRRLPPNITIVGEIESFNEPASLIETSEILLTNGTIISGVEHIILGTGFRYTYPFLPQYINPSLGINNTLPRDEAVIQPIVTDGTHLRSLYRDAFYIPDPTLLFINANSGAQAFTFAEFVSLAAAKVWSGTADLPNEAALWEWYNKAIIERLGFGKHFQFYGTGRTQEALRFFVGWLNDAAIQYGGKQIDNLPYEHSEIGKIWVGARWGSPGSSSLQDGLVPVVTPDVGANVNGSGAWARDLVYSEWW